MRTDAHELVHRAQRAHHGPFFDGHVSGQGRAVHQHGVISDHAIMPDVRVGHDEQMTAPSGYAAAFDGSAIDGNVLANFVVVTNFELRGLAFVSDVLWGHTN